MSDREAYIREWRDKGYTGDYIPESLKESDPEGSLSLCPEEEDNDGSSRQNTQT